MGRCLRTTVPQAREQFLPQWSCLPRFQRDEQKHKGKQEKTLTSDTEPLRYQLSPMGQTFGSRLNGENGENGGVLWLRKLKLLDLT